MKAIVATTIFLVLLLAAAVGFASPEAGPFLVLEIEGKGTIKIKLHTSEAPVTTKRIIELTNQKFYDGQRFFKVIRQPRPFLAQVGDPNSRTKRLDDPSLGTSGTGKRLAYEDSGFSHVPGAVGLSHLPNDKDSGDCQFYIVLGKSSFLDGNYTVFGQVSQGMDQLERLELGDRITSARIESN